MKNPEYKNELVEKVDESNKAISSSILVTTVTDDLNNNLRKVCGDKVFNQEAYIETCDANFDQIIKNLKVNYWRTRSTFTSTITSITRKKSRW